MTKNIIYIKVHSGNKIRYLHLLTFTAMQITMRGRFAHNWQWRAISRALVALPFRVVLCCVVPHCTLQSLHAGGPLLFLISNLLNILVFSAFRIAI